MSPRQRWWTRPESFLVAAVAAACLAGVVLATSTDYDLWGHVTFGRDILADAAIKHTDSYSFASDRTWINHEWLSEVLMAASYAAMGPSGLIVLKVFIVAATAVLLVARLRRAPISFERAALLFLVAVVGTKSQAAHIRPQLFSMLLFTALLTTLTLSDEGKRRRSLIVVPAIFLIWANLHGGWIVGAGVLAIWTAIRVLDSKRPGSERRTAILVAAIAAAATAVNPFGIRLWQFLLETVRIDRTEITDWQPVTYSLDILTVWVGIAVVCVVLVRRSKPTLFAAITLAVLAASSFRVLRLEPFFALAAALLLPSIETRRDSKAHKPERMPLRVSRGAALTVMAISIIAIAACAVFIARNGSCIPIDPVGNPEPEATAFVRQRGLHGRMITWFDWGEYAIWHFAPAIQVSMDGRRETVYSSAVTSAHLAFYRGDASLPERLHADYIWVPRNLPVVNALLTSGWSPLFDGPVSIVFGRGSTSPPVGPSTIAARRCFPGP